MPISDALAQALTARRAEFNARVVETRHRYPAFDTAAFAVFLQTSVDAIVRAVATVAPERVLPVVAAVYDIALELVGQALAGPAARSTLVDRVWQNLAPNYAHLLAQQPVEVLGALSNAALNIGKVPTARPDQWLNGMAQLAPHVDSLAHLHALGQVLAWRSGLAQFRFGAVRAADQLPESVALAAVGAKPDATWSSVRDGFLADRWWSPDGKTEIGLAGIEIGQFSGFGGTFGFPPSARARADGFVVRSGDRYSFLVADVYGAVLQPATADEFEQAEMHSAKVAPLKESKLTSRRAKLGLPQKGMVVVCNEYAAAITSPYTYSVLLLPLQ